MIEDVLLSSGESLTFVLLIVALGIFAWLTARSRKIKSFQFQISMFIVIWITGEIVDFLREGGVIQVAMNNAGLYIHVLAMALFSSMLWIRFYLSRKSGKKMADSLQEI